MKFLRLVIDFCLYCSVFNLSMLHSYHYESMYDCLSSLDRRVHMKTWSLSCTFTTTGSDRPRVLDTHLDVASALTLAELHVRVLTSCVKGNTALTWLQQDLKGFLVLFKKIQFYKREFKTSCQRWPTHVNVSGGIRFRASIGWSKQPSHWTAGRYMVF